MSARETKTVDWCLTRIHDQEGIIEKLRADLARTTERAEGYVRQLEEAEDRLDAVIALCEPTLTSPCDAHCRIHQVRAAATGETK